MNLGNATGVREVNLEGAVVGDAGLEPAAFRVTESSANHATRTQHSHHRPLSEKREC